jgi:hypothetical protein
MFKKSKEIEIDENDIFKNDELEREDIIKDLSKLVISNNDPFVFILVHGKMTLQMNHYILDNFDTNTPVTNGLTKVVKTGTKVLRRGLPAFVSGATAGLLDLDSGIEKAISSMSEQTTKSLIENYSSEKNVLENIDEDKPFVIFIDELDRCRPLCAIELLERIKHVFGIENLIFVLSIDKKQLVESIKSQYGNINADVYLKRFIDLEYNLTNINVDKFCESKYRQFNIKTTLKTKIDIDEALDGFHHLNIMKILANKLKLSLRDIEQVFIKINIMFSIIEPSDYAHKIEFLDKFNLETK